MSSTDGRRSLVVYLVCEPETAELAEAAVEGGADLVELGIPFSDPLAEGPTIRLASERALARGMRTAECLECIAAVRDRVDVPLVPMTYAAILEAYGYERFVADSRAAGATTAIVVDLPVEEHPEVPRVQLVAPTSTDERIALCAGSTDGWLYLVSLTGTTGARDEVSPALAGLVERARAATGVPLYAGFGISTPAHAAAVAALTDGVVVGSRAIQVAEDGPGALRDYVRTLRDAIDAVAAMTSAVVVGAGVFGASTARELDRRGWDVTLVEQYTPGHVRSGSGGDTRLLRFSHGEVEWYTLLARRALELWREVEAEAGAAPVRAGRARVVRHGRERLHAAQRADAATARHPVRPADAGGARQASTRRSAVDDLRSVLFEPEAGVLYARLATRALASGLPLRARPRDAGRPARSRRRRLGVRRVAAPASSRSSSASGSPAVTSSSSASTRPGPAVPGFCDYDGPYYGHGELGGYGMKISPDGPGPEVDPDLVERLPDPEREALARAYTARRFPSLAGAPIVGARVCQYDLTPDTHFLVARHPERPDWWLVGGGSGHGFKHGPALAEYVADCVEGRREPEPFHGLGPRSGHAGLRTASTEGEPG